ncbi:cell division protein FtsL [Paenisporosarcina cavernae]|uniref:Cell division protein FtsL n=1 Tax=Paenisporosarcina cavernae TaxID=2320858 RepID=A0A385YTB4_9BACL|nr:cell division protein FtsL [Paenisporosarcina cavernae]AYC29157.1 cell division protein FtsL [Paenisporosarcina cavernae]
MALHARTSPYIKQPAVQPTPTVQPSRKVRRKTYTKGEAILFTAFITIAAIMAVISLSMQAQIHSATQEIQAIEQSVAETQKQNTDLSIQVSELSTYERIWEKAQALGLTLNEKNVKVVPGQ